MKFTYMGEQYRLCFRREQVTVEWRWEEWLRDKGVDVELGLTKEGLDYLAALLGPEFKIKAKTYQTMVTHASVVLVKDGTTLEAVEAFCSPLDFPATRENGRLEALKKLLERQGGSREWEAALKGAYYGRLKAREKEKVTT